MRSWSSYEEDPNQGHKARMQLSQQSNTNFKTRNYWFKSGLLEGSPAYVNHMLLC